MCSRATDGRPSALLELTDAAKTSGPSRHELVLELRRGAQAISRHQVVVTLAGAQFLDAYRQDLVASGRLGATLRRPDSQKYRRPA